MPKKKAAKTAKKKTSSGVRSTNQKVTKKKVAKQKEKSNKVRHSSDVKSEETSTISEVALAPKEKKPEETRNNEKRNGRRPKIKTLFSKERILTENSNEARELYNQSRYGTVLENGQVQLSMHETLYLIEKNKIELIDGRKKEIDFEDFFKKANKIEPNFWIRYSVFKDMRNRGYIIKTALKFGADFRVYDRGVKPGEDHARWVVYPVHEGSTLTWYEFAAKNRVAHSTKKRLMIAVVDDESDVTYWEIKWVRP